MKKTLLLIAVFTLALNTYSQKLIKRDTIFPQVQTDKNDEVQTLFNGNKSFGGYFAFTMGYTSIDGDDAFIAGGRLMFVANHYLGIGFGGKGIVSSTNNNYTIIPTFPSTYEYYSNYVCGYGGFYIEPVIKSLKPVHIAFPILLGGGAMQYITWDDNFSNITNNSISNNSLSSVFMVVEPGVDIEFNIAKWFRIGIGTSYRITSGLKENENYKSNMLNNFNYGITFKMGYF